MKGGRFSPGQAYVAFSWVKTLQGLYILNFNANAIKASEDVKHETDRLSDNLLSPIPVITSQSHPHDCINVALFNMRSLTAGYATSHWSALWEHMHAHTHAHTANTADITNVICESALLVVLAPLNYLWSCIHTKMLPHCHLAIQSQSPDSTTSLSNLTVKIIAVHATDTCYVEQSQSDPWVVTYT